MSSETITRNDLANIIDKIVAIDGTDMTSQEVDIFVNSLDITHAYTFLDIFYPVGSYYETSDTTFNPNTTWGGTWVLETEGQVHISAGTNYVINGANTNTTDGGSATHTHPLDGGSGYADAIATGTVFYENYVTVPSRTMALKWTINSQQSSTNTTTYAIPLKGSTASASSHPPYIIVNRWHRTA